MGYTIAICDDDKNMADKLTVSLKNEFMKAGRNDVIIDYYDTGVQLLETLKNKMYKAVLLDINMEPMDGFSVAEAIGKSGYRTKIIFVTSHEDVVYDTFDYTPFYFIRKSRYETYVQRVVKKLIAIDGYEKTIVLDDKDGIININSGDITYVHSEDHYLTVHTADGNSYVIRKNMMEFGQDIAGTDIIRAHKKYMINYRYISRINQSTNEVIMKAGETLKLGRSYKDTFMKGYRNGMAVRTLKLLQHIPFIKGWAKRFSENKRETLERVDSQIAELHQQRKSTFYASLSLEFMARVLGCLEVYFILNILTTDVSFPACILIMAFTSLFANLFFFSPMQLGAREGGFALAVGGLAIPGAFGVYTGLITRVRELIWIVIGVLLMKVGNGTPANK